MFDRRLALLFLLGLGFAPSSAVAAEATIQPGDYVDLECTLGWLFDGADGGVYFATAGHCTSAPGEEVRLATFAIAQTVPGERLGKVRLRGEPASAETDVALIEVDQQMRGRAAPELRGHPEVPAGVSPASDLTSGSLLQLSGWGTGFESSATTREQRQGLLLAGSAGAWEGLVPATGGDSGGPVSDVASGNAVGLVKGHHATATGTGSWGPTVGAILELARSNGLSLTIRLAGQPPPTPPPPPSTAPRGSPQPPPVAKPPSRRSRVAAKRAACRTKARKIRSARKRRAALRRCARIKR